MPLKKKVEPKMKKLYKYEINQIIGGDNLFGEYLNNTNLNLTSTVSKTDLKVKYKKEYLVMYFYICIII